jgi:hypothetical protein
VFSEFKAIAECPQLLKAVTLLTEDVPPRCSLFSLKARGSYFGPTPRQKALCEPAALALLLKPYKVEAERPYLASFIGSRMPPRRSQIINRLEHEFSKDRKLKVTKKWGVSSNSLGNQSTIFWHVSVPENPSRLPFETYAQILGESNFSFCLPGFTGTSSRPLESMYRGAIPVVSASERDRYDIPLIDNVNSILVWKNRWDDAFQRIRTMRPIQVKRMRERLKTDSHIWLEWPILEQRLIRKLCV